jgi:hypothetical protein
MCGNVRPDQIRAAHDVIIKQQYQIARGAFDTKVARRRLTAMGRFDYSQSAGGVERAQVPYRSVAGTIHNDHDFPIVGREILR